MFLFLYRKNHSKGSEEEKLVCKKKNKRSSKASDPTEIHRMHCNTPGLLKHPPIPVNTFEEHVESLKAHGLTKFLQEFEVATYLKLNKTVLPK